MAKFFVDNNTSPVGTVALFDISFPAVLKSQIPLPDSNTAVELEVPAHINSTADLLFEVFTEK